MATTGAHAGIDSSTASQQSHRRQGKLFNCPGQHPLGLSVADPEALQAGIALVRQHVKINPLADACQSIVKPPAIERQLGRLFTSEILIGQMFVADRQRLQQITAGISEPRR